MRAAAEDLTGLMLQRETNYRIPVHHSDVKHTGQIERFHLLKEFHYHPIAKEYMLVGIVGSPGSAGYEEISSMPEL